MGIKHVKVSAIADAADTTKVRPSDWNTDHTIDGDVDFNGNDIVNCGNFGASAGLFTSLGDVPNSYAGAGGKVVAVSGSESGLEFVTGGTSASNLDWVTPQDFGAVADGTSHPLSEFYGTLAEAQAAYDGAYFFATSLTQEIDYIACKACSNAAFGPDTIAPDGDGTVGNMGDFLVTGTGTTSSLDGGFSFYIKDSEPDLVPNALVGAHTVAFVTYGSSPGFVASSPVVSNTTRKVTCGTAVALTSPTSFYAFGQGENGDNSQLNNPIYLPAGSYMLGGDIWTIRNLRSGVIRGAGKLVSTLYGDEGCLAFDGIWYSHLSDFACFLTGNGVTTGRTPLELDGNIPGHAYETRGVQSVTLDQIFCYAAGAKYCFAMCRRGGGNAQGSECLFLNVHLQGPCTEACYYQDGFNALANTFLGGNIQGYTKYGIYVLNGTLAVFNMGFQSTNGYVQVQNGGYDISFVGGAFESCCVYGCRTESLPFLYNEGSVHVDVRAVAGVPAQNVWSDLTTFGPTTDRPACIASGQLWIAQANGTSGASAPTWSSDGVTSVVDGSVTWDPLPFYFIYNGSGGVDVASIRHSYGKLFWLECSDGLFASGTLDENAKTVAVDASAGNITVAMPSVYAGVNRGVVVKRIDNTSNTVTVSGVGDNGASSTDVIEPLGFRTYAALEPGSGVDHVAWYIANASRRQSRGNLGNVNNDQVSAGQTITLCMLNIPQHYDNNGAHTLSPSTTYHGQTVLDITNIGSAGAITTSAWTKVIGDAFDTTDTHKFRCFCSVGSAGSLLDVKAMQ